MLAFNPLAPRCNVTLYAAHDEPHSTLELKVARVVALPAPRDTNEVARVKQYMCCKQSLPNLQFMHRAPELIGKRGIVHRKGEAGDNYSVVRKVAKNGSRLQHKQYYKCEHDGRRTKHGALQAVRSSHKPPRPLHPPTRNAKGRQSDAADLESLVFFGLTAAFSVGGS